MNYIIIDQRKLLTIFWSAFSNSSKPIKFAHLQKLANQLTLNKAHVIEIKVPWLFDVERNVSIEKKTEDGEDLFFKALVNRFWLTS